ncbi:transcriptional regulator [Klebsiella pneumoniae]|uniref:plasmid replication initiator TrfA n=1 Tax=Klebsiella pneumoniae TaxID=573 RepID=UPI001C7F1873|nr:plasmid replication initiator TrfA [Klebsiella pneumoniae]MBX4558815.1 transcriptional regulator [Klebsiella pneumoniae]
MADYFNKQEYIRKLIDSGVEPDKAEEIASRTNYYRNRSAQAEVRPIGEAITLPGIPEPEAPALSDTTKAKQNTTEASDPAPAAKGETMSDKKPGRKKGATDALASKVDEARQAALLKHTKQEIKDAQLSLFDIAPWGDHMRALPNDYARSALFTVRNKRVPRAALQGEPIYSIGNDVNITYTGVELRAEDDELVWQQVMEYSKRSPIGDPIDFTFYELCKDLGWSINGHYYKKAEECLSRLQASAMQFESKRVGRLESLSLISRFRVLDRGKRTSRCQVMIDEEMVVLFAGDHYSRFIWDKYRKLSPTARRMFDYFASHKEPFPLKLETFRLMCGSESTRAKKWREQVWVACEELKESGLVADAWVSADSLGCRRS